MREDIVANRACARCESIAFTGITTRDMSIRWLYLWLICATYVLSICRGFVHMTRGEFTVGTAGEPDRAVRGGEPGLSAEQPYTVTKHGGAAGVKVLQTPFLL